MRLYIRLIVNLTLVSRASLSHLPHHSTVFRQLTHNSTALLMYQPVSTLFFMDSVSNSTDLLSVLSQHPLVRIASITDATPSSGPESDVVLQWCHFAAQRWATERYSL
jgi:hypothetical protein